MSPTINKIVDAYVASPPIPHQTQDLASIRQDFLEHFLEGFIDPHALISSPNNAAFYGSQEGQKFRLDNPDKIDETMEAYGYTLTSSEGTLFFGKEAGFHPGDCPDVVWHYQVLGAGANWPPVNERIDGLKVILQGYLSPEHHRRQLYIGAREVLVTNVQKLMP